MFRFLERPLPTHRLPQLLPCSLHPPPSTGSPPSFSSLGPDLYAISYRLFPDFYFYYPGVIPRLVPPFNPDGPAINYVLCTTPLQIYLPRPYLRFLGSYVGRPRGMDCFWLVNTPSSGQGP